MDPYNPRFWFEHLFDVRGSMVREITGRVALCVGWAVIVTAAHALGGESLRWFEPPATIHVLAGSALAALLVFRTNSSYERFWEGRKLWGGIVNETRNLVRTTAAILADDPATVREVGLSAIAFAHSAMAELRGKKSLGSVANELSAEVVERLLAADHVPYAVCRHVTSLLARARAAGRIDSVELGIIDRNTHLLVDHLGGCERIRATLLPFAYAVHLRRVLVIFFLTLPIVIVPDFGWATIVAVFLSSYVFFGIEEIGVEVENPFGENVNDLPLERICGIIERDVRGALGDSGQGRGSGGAPDAPALPV